MFHNIKFAAAAGVFMENVVNIFESLLELWFSSWRVGFPVRVDCTGRRRDCEEVKGFWGKLNRARWRGWVRGRIYVRDCLENPANGMDNEKFDW